MPTILTNNTNVSLSMALWLADDDYDYDDDPNTISATTLLKPMKAIVLARQNSDLVKTGDVVSMAASRIGTAMHDAIERTWRKKASKIRRILCMLGLPKAVAGKIIVDPTQKEVDAGCIPVYMEIRSYKQVGKYRISGKFDFVMNGHLEDFKSTSTYTFVNKTNNTKYPKQGSLYRWLNPTIITDNIMTIVYFFTDWKAGLAYDSNYPQHKVLSVKFTLDTIENTQAFVERQVDEIDRLMPLGQDDMPVCTREELWQGPGKWKYYKKKGAKRATKNFDIPSEAHDRLILDGNTGEVIHFPDQPTACTYCDVNELCKQGSINVAFMRAAKNK